MNRKFFGKEFLIEPLSDPEINRLLSFLEENSSLGALEDLNQELRIAAIKNRHGKELLITMRETIEGNSFDAILENEFRGIKDTIAQQAYLITCCFYQFGVLLRTPLLADLLGVDEPTMYKQTEAATEGVVIYESINEAQGIYAARSRHKLIASVVWTRCGDRAFKENLLQRALGRLNLNYGSDIDAFEHLIREDQLVDSIGSFDGKVKFFEIACRKDPDSPYVRQHYARMLSREGKFEIALGEIDKALKINPIRILHHTKGKILAELAFSIESYDLARKRMVQSEEAFRAGLKLKENDEYCYQGLAELYFGWAKNAQNENEVRDYLEKAENTISTALPKVKIREGLLILSSNIAEFVGDNPKHMRTLAAAIQDTPGGIIARYLLGRAYRQKNSPDQALEVLEPAIKAHPDAFRCCMEYARSLLDLGKPYSEAIAVLKLSGFIGYSDPAFVALLGGLLFLNGNFSEATTVFAETEKQDFSANERNSVLFQPLSKEKLPKTFTGKVVAVKAGYAFIESEGYPNFFCPGSKWYGIILKKSAPVKFQIGFSPKGPVAIKPELLS